MLAPGNIERASENLYPDRDELLSRRFQQKRKKAANTGNDFVMLAPAGYNRGLDNCIIFINFHLR